jgi:polyhydroxybutyrate depolymerase
MSAACSDSTSASGTQGLGGDGAGGHSGSSGGGAKTGGALSAGGAMATAGTMSMAGAMSAAGAGGSLSAGGSQSGSSGATSAGGMSAGGMSAAGAMSTAGTPSAGGSQSGSSGATSTGGMPGGGAGALGGMGGRTGGAGGMAGAGMGGQGGAGSPTTSPGCGTTLTRPDPKAQQTMDIGGTTRYYLLDVPAATDNKTPLSLVFALHGYDMNNVAVVGLFNFTSRSNGKTITVYPQGEGPAPGNTSHWGDEVLKSTWTANDANYAFIHTLMTDLESRFCVDPSRVFLTGFSMGGMFTNSLACDHNDWFRGFAPVEGLGPSACANADAKPAVIVHQGTADTLVTPDKGEATRDFWLQQNGCNQTTTPSFTGCQAYGGCAQGRPVVYCVGNWDHTITGTAAGNIWSFFSQL